MADAVTETARGGQRTSATTTGTTTKTPKNFVCRRDGCNKRFTRDEHLQRHALNHTAGDYTCARCRAHFKRPDLLERHLQRHRQRDLEVGAAGSGVLNTRKRAWKALDGTVVQKKPALTAVATPAVPTAPAAPTTPPTTTVPGADTATSAAEREWADRLILAAGHINTIHNPNNIYAAATISPPQTHVSSSLSDPGRQESAEAESYESYESYQAHEYLPSLDPQHQQQQQQQQSPSEQQFAIPPFVPVVQPEQQQQPQPAVGFLFDDVFQPDTASSFNMPYTTAVNYNWLFSMDENTFEGPSGVADAPVQSVQPMQTIQTVQPMPFQSLPQEQDTRQSNAASLDYFVISPESASASSQTLVFDDAPQDHTMDLASPPKMQLTPTSPHSVFASSRPSPVSAHEPLLPAVPRQQAAHTAHTAQTRLLPDLERPLSSIHPPSHLPVIDHETRERLLQVVDACHPALPDGQLSTWDHPLLAMAPLQEFCDLFFTRFNTAYPLLHQATFQPSTTEPLLLLAVLLLGTTYSSKEAHQLAVCIHDVMRPRIFAHTDFGAKPSLWMLQTILLVECFGKSRAGQKQHDMSHLFHGLLINLIRRSDCQSARATVPAMGSLEENSMATETKWRAWAMEEEMKRLALLCFMWDTQHAVLFCQSLCMSAFELRLTLPCSQRLWEAQTAAAWKGVAVQQGAAGQDMFFLAALKMYLTPSSPTSSTTSSSAKSAVFSQLNALSRVLLLHGLLSISWDMQRRDQTALGVVDNMVVGVGGGNSIISGGSSGHWSDRLSEAYDRWKLDFDGYCADMAERQQAAMVTETMNRDGGEEHENVAAHWQTAARECATFATAYKAIYHAAHVLLNSDFLDVQIYAGARHILGRPVQRGDFLRSERVIKRWANGVTDSSRDGSSDNGKSGTPATAAAKAAWHAACLLHDAAQHLDDFDAMGLFHVPWCLYLATLTCWVFHHTRRRPTGSHGPTDDSGEIVWDARQEMDALVAGMAGATPLSLVVQHQQQQQPNREQQNTGGLVWVMANVLSNVRWGIVHAGVVVLRGLVPLRMINQYEGV
ncbi:hypothetical protein SCUCBS95973_003691 [Sporothrix curviconia]|uniref:C2H2-type domain-containing protein n=1 Tax=Sporothrix curviconia TaxID=1260050 RepID=A0ABP0BIG5_9PEZI